MLVNNKLSFLILLITLVLKEPNAHAQVKIGNNPSTINSDAVLELESTTKAFLPPRMNTAQMNAITAQGAVVYNTDEGCLFIKNETRWVSTCPTRLLLSQTNPFFSSLGSAKIVSTNIPQTYTSEVITLSERALVLLNFSALVGEFRTANGEFFQTDQGTSAKMYYVLIQRSNNDGSFTNIFTDAQPFSTTTNYISGKFVLNGSKSFDLPSGSHRFRFIFNAFAATSDTSGLSYELSNDIASFLEIIKL